jgi:large subunit ribosomal protein L10e
MHLNQQDKLQINILRRGIPQGYSFKVLVYPHNVIREHKMAQGAGADRISRGMSQAFGRPMFVAASD